MINTIKALKPGEKAVFDTPEDACKKLKLIMLQKQAYENLFQSYINRTTEQADAFNLEAFLQAYARLHIAQTEIVDDAAAGVVGGLEGLKEVKRSGIRYVVNYEAGKVIFMR